MITTGSPPEAMKRILSVLETMGIVVEAEHEYRYRCTRPRRHTDFEDLGMVTVSGNDYSKSIMSRTRPSEVLETPYPRRNLDSGLEDDFERSFTANLSSGPVDEPKEARTRLFCFDIMCNVLLQLSTTLSRNIIPHGTSINPSIPAELPPEATTPDIHIHGPPAPVPSTSSIQPLSQPVPNMIPQENHLSPEPIVIPRKPSHLLSHPTSLSSSLDSDVGLLHAPPNNNSIAYGPRSEDPGEEVRFTAELTRLENLDTTYSLDIRRLKGNLRSYKFLYDTLRERTDLQATT
ncbi:hypothetical protein C0989_007754 [Termitomyces sp. Mn162]|nr:hypothetical protein C0989_007754 [Termitomyces sp. Mn162]